jgi:hypothetical protein
MTLAVRKARRGPVALGVLAVLVAAGGCASAPVDDGAWRDVRVVERTREGETHLALPKTLPGCNHVGMARVNIPEGVPGLPPEILDRIKKQAARLGGNTLVLLPGRRIEAGSLRGSVFSCPPGSQPAQSSPRP